ncbi:MAG: hypothetical protein RLZZ156_10 [Deinococcota bacterium]|jgi:hypothetical protein
MKKVITLALLPVALMACLQAPSPEVKPVSPDQTFKPTLLGSVTLQIDSNLGIQGSKFIPNRRLSSQTLSPVTESNLVFTRETLVNIDRPSSGDRYLNAPFKVTNNNSSNLQNLTLVAYHKNGNVGGSAFKDIQTFGGTLNPNVNTLLPIHTMTGSGTVVVDNTKADLQIFTRGEIATLTTASAAPNGTLLNPGEGILHYGFIARKGSSGTYRTIAGTACDPVANVGCNEGTINLALRVPQTTDPSGVNAPAYRYSMTFLVFTDSAARVTESIEEQGTTNAATRATALGGSPQVVAMCGTSRSSSNTTYITGVRTVGVGVNTETALMGGKFVLTSTTTPNFTVNGNISKNFNTASGLLSTGLSALGGATLTTALVGTPTNSSNITVNTDGSLSINPAANLRTTDSFNYSIADGTCTWTRPAGVTIQNAVTWFVKNNVATTGDGRFSSPFKTLVEAQTASLANDTIYVYNGDNSTTGQNAGITLKAGQKLIGQGVALTVGGDAIEVAGTNAKVGNGAGTAIMLSTNNTLNGLDVNTTGIGISGSSFGTLTVSAVNVNVSNNTALNLATGTLAATFGTITSANGVNGVSFDGCDGTITATNGTLSSSSGPANHVVNIVNTSGTNSLNFTYGGTINKTTDGAAVNILGLSGTGAATFNGNVTGNNVSDGVMINTTSRPVTFSTLYLGTSAARFTTTPVALVGNTGAVDLGVFTSYTNAVPALEINYSIASPGLVTTDAGSLLDATGAATALLVSHSTSQSLNLNFATISATGAGTHGVNLNRSSGSLTVTGSTAFGAKTVAGIQITNSSLATSFKKVDVNGAADGVKLSANTGSFSITGDGNWVNVHTNSAGGTFTNLTNNAFDLTSVQNVQLTDITINGTGSHGVIGSGVSGTTIFSNVDMTNIGNADNEHVFNFQEGAVSGAQVSGSFEVNNSEISNFTDNGVYLENFTGTLDFRWTNNNLRNNITTTACGGGNCNGNGILLRADGTSRINALILNAVFEDIDGIGVTANPEGNSGARMDINIAQSNFTAEPYGGTGNTNNGETAISLRNQQGNSIMNFRLFSNDINDYTGELALGVVEIEGGDFTTTNGIIDTLYIYHAHAGNGLQIFADGANTGGSGTTNFTMNVSMNDINFLAATPILGSSILLSNNGAISGSIVQGNYIITNSRLLANATGTSRRTLTINARDFNDVCARVQTNIIAAGTSGTQPSINLSYNGSGAVRLQGMSGSGDTNAIAYLGANNTLSVAAISGPNNNVTSATCTTPTIPGVFPF